MRVPVKPIQTTVCMRASAKENETEVVYHALKKKRKTEKINATAAAAAAATEIGSRHIFRATCIQ